MSNIFDIEVADRTATYAEVDTEPTAMARMAPAQPPSQQGEELRTLVDLARGVQRNPEQMAARARRVGERMASLGRALYSFPAGQGRVEGPTVQLAEALGQEWGHLWTGVRIDRMDGDVVHMTAVVFDAVAGSFLTRPHIATLSEAPGKFRDKAEQVARWEAMQTQAGISKAIRTALLHALPGWFVEEAVQAARNLTRRDVLKGKPVAEAAADAIAHFEAQWKVSRDQLVAKVGATPNLWTASDVVDLRMLAGRLKSGDTTVAAEFEPRQTRNADLRRTDAPTSSASLVIPDALRTEPAADPPPAAADRDELKEQIRQLRDWCGANGCAPDAEALITAIGGQTGRPVAQWSHATTTLESLRDDLLSLKVEREARD